MKILSKLYKWLIRHRVVEEAKFPFDGKTLKSKLRWEDFHALRKAANIDFQNRWDESFQTSVNRWVKEEKERIQRERARWATIEIAKEAMEPKVENLLKLLDDETTARFYKEARTQPPQDPSTMPPWPAPTTTHPRLGVYKPYQFGTETPGDLMDGTS